MWTTPRFTLTYPGYRWEHQHQSYNVPYYNPKSDFSVVPPERGTVLYRHYDTVWTQQGIAGVGGYRQQGERRWRYHQVGYDNGSNGTTS